MKIDKSAVSAYWNAAIAVVCVFCVMAVCLGVVSILGSIAPSTRDSDVDYRYLPGSDDVSNDEASSAILDEPFYVLLLGSDSRKGTALYTGKAQEHSQLDQRADVITLVYVDPVQLKLAFITVPRDTWIDSMNAKINEALAYDNDPQDVVDEVEKLTGASIRYYLMTSFVDFEDLVDGLDGIVVDVPRTVTVADPSTADDVTVKAGEDKELDGSEALVLARARRSYSGQQDGLRQVNVRNIEEAIVLKGIQLCSGRDDSEGLETLIKLISSFIDTDIPESEMVSLIKRFSEDPESVAFISCTGPYQGDLNEDDVWVVESDEEAWRELLETVESGGDPSSVVKTPSFTRN